MLLSALLFIAGVAATPITPHPQWNWKLQTQHAGADFFDRWEFQTIDDPTHGRINYVNKSTAQEKRLAWAENGQFGFKVDTDNIVDRAARGRDSVRIMSYEKYGYVMIVADIEHMPTGCGTWPAFWTIGTEKEWPAGGEVDIIEVYNGKDLNLITLHTQDNGTNVCAMPDKLTSFSGKLRNTRCNGGGGCNIEERDPKSFGAGFNANKGGHYVARRNTAGWGFWFFPRGTAPDGIKNGLDIVDENTLGTKIADFPLVGCNLRESFEDQHLIFNTVLGGDSIRGSWNSSGCLKDNGDLDNFILNKPDQFNEAYWLINSVKIYQRTA